MEKKEKRYKFLIVNVLGIFFLFLGFMAVFNSLLIKNPSHVLWMCYISLILIGIGIVMRKSVLVMSQVYILAIPLVIWDVDFLYYLITQKTLLGLTNYFFVDAAWNLGKIISLQHLYTIPVSLSAKEFAKGISTKLFGSKPFSLAASATL